MISFCIPTYKGGPRLRRLFESIAAQDLRQVPAGDRWCEILVIDDGSPADDAADIVAAIDTCPIPNVRRIASTINRGPVAALADVTREARGDVIVQCDDDIVLPRTFTKTLSELLKIPNVGVLSWRSRGTGPGQSSVDVPGFLEPATQLAGYCMAYFRSVYDKVDGIDTAFSFYCSDSDFALRVALAGHPCYRVWWPLVPHDEHQSVVDNDRRHAMARVDLYTFLQKWGTTGPEMERRALAHFRGEGP